MGDEFSPPSSYKCKMSTCEAAAQRGFLLSSGGPATGRTPSHTPETGPLLALPPGVIMGDPTVKALKDSDMEMHSTRLEGNGDTPAKGQHQEQGQGEGLIFLLYP